MKTSLSFFLLSLATRSGRVHAHFLRSGRQEAAASIAADDTDESRELFFGNLLCGAIEDSFNHDVECECRSRFGEGTKFSCESKEEVCLDTQFKKYCAIPMYEGSLGWQVASGKIDISTRICSKSNKFERSSIGSGSMDDLCIDVDLCSDKDEDIFASVCSCEATYGTKSCNTCEPCETEDGVPGLSVVCGDVYSPTCMPFSVPFSHGTGVPESNSVSPFVAQLEVAA